MSHICHNLLLADDDMDDCIFFKEALSDIDLNTTLTIVNDGEELLNYLEKNQHNLPDLLFLDLNMPRRSGFECLKEIKLSDDFKHLPIVVFSTSFDMEIVKVLYEKGAHFYIRKPAEFNKLKQLIRKAITLACIDNQPAASHEWFVLKPG